MIKYCFWKRKGLLLLLLILLIPIVQSLPIYVKPLSGDALQPSTTFNYIFNFTINSDCTGVVLSDTSTITTGTDGIGFIGINTSSLSTIPSYLCEYKDGTLRKTHTLSDALFKDVYARNVYVNNSIGIGTTNTSAKLHVIGDVKANSFNGSWNESSKYPLKIDLKNNITDFNKSIVHGHNQSAFVTENITSGDGNTTFSGGTLFLNFLDLAEFNNSVSAFITTAVSTLTNYFTKTESISHISGNISDVNTSQTAYTDSQIDLINTSANIYTLTPHNNLTASAIYTLTPHTNTTAGGNGGNVTASASLTDNAIVRGDGGAKGIQDSSWYVTDTGRLSNVVSPATALSVGSKSNNIINESDTYFVSTEGINLNIPTDANQYAMGIRHPRAGSGIGKGLLIQAGFVGSDLPILHLQDGDTNANVMAVNGKGELNLYPSTSKIGIAQSTLSSVLSIGAYADKLLNDSSNNSYSAVSDKGVNIRVASPNAYAMGINNPRAGSAHLGGLLIKAGVLAYNDYIIRAFDGEVIPTERFHVTSNGKIYMNAKVNITNDLWVDGGNFFYDASEDCLDLYDDGACSIPLEVGDNGVHSGYLTGRVRVGDASVSPSKLYVGSGSLISDGAVTVSTLGVNVNVSDKNNYAMGIENSPSSGYGLLIKAGHNAVAGYPALLIQNYLGEEIFNLDGKGNLIINNASLDGDVRIQSNDENHMFFIDAGNNRIGIKKSSPNYELDVGGTINASAFIGNSMTIGSSTDVKNITMFTNPSGNPACCGVMDDFSWGCSAGACE